MSLSSLLDVKSYIYLCEKLRAWENDQNTFSSIDQSQKLNDCNCTFILTIHLMFTWLKSNQKKKKNYSHNHILFFHHLHLSFITYFFAQWMTIIEQKNAVSTYITIMNAKKTSHLRIENRIETLFVKNIINEEQSKDDVT